MPATVASTTDRPPLSVVGDEVTELLSGAEFEVFEVTGPAESGPPPHAHPWDEAYLVLDGEMVVSADGVDHPVAAGARVMIPAGTLHCYRIVSPSARFLVTTGGQRAGAFFRDMDATVPPGPPTDATLPTIIEVAMRNALTSPLFD